MANFSDNFSGTLGAWDQEDGTWEIVSGRTRVSSTGSGSRVLARMTVAGQTYNNCEVSFVVQGNGSNQGDELGAMILLITDTGDNIDGYGLLLFNDRVYMPKIVNGSESPLASVGYSEIPGTPTSLDGHKLTMRRTVSGGVNTIEVLIDDVQVGSTPTDSDYPGPLRAGLGLFVTNGGTTNVFFDDFDVVDLDESFVDAACSLSGSTEINKDPDTDAELTFSVLRTAACNLQGLTLINGSVALDQEISLKINRNATVSLSGTTGVTGSLKVSRNAACSLGGVTFFAASVKVFRNSTCDISGVTLISHQELMADLLVGGFVEALGMSSPGAEALEVLS